jgi:hypothetical protein
MTTTTAQTAPASGALAAQALFEGMFPEGYTPMIDTRTPAGLGHRKSPDAAERAEMREQAAAERAAREPVAA